jgi:hypothetical protein
MRFATSEERDTTMQHGAEEGAKGTVRADRRGAGEDRGVKPGAAVACAAQGGHARIAAHGVDCWWLLWHGAAVP